MLHLVPTSLYVFVCKGPPSALTARGLREHVVLGWAGTAPAALGSQSSTATSTPSGLGPGAGRSQDSRPG